jgi:hypothetical protein
MSSIPFTWYLALTPNDMFSLYAYHIPGKRSPPFCQEHGLQLILVPAGRQQILPFEGSKVSG